MPCLAAQNNSQGYIRAKMRDQHENLVLPHYLVHDEIELFARYGCNEGWCFVGQVRHSFVSLLWIVDAVEVL